MIRKLRRRFIFIATVSVALVMILLTFIVNIAYYISVNSDLTEMLNIIYENQGIIPAQIGKKNDDSNKKAEKPAEYEADMGKEGEVADGTEESRKPPVSSNKSEISAQTVYNNLPIKKNGPPKKPSKPGSQFNQETPYSTRYFVLRVSSEGEVIISNLEHISAVTEENIGEYAKVAARHGIGYGFYKNYKFYVAKHGNDRYMAIFLDCYQEMRSVRLLTMWSIIADVFCVILVYILVTLFSRRAIDPIVRSAERQKQFITDASHELKTPLTVIDTCLSVLKMEVGEQKWIDKAQIHTKKMGELINSLMTLSRLDEEEPHISMVEFCISEAVSEVVESFRDAVEGAGYRLEADIAPDISYRGDETAIRKLIGILMDNALKYTSENGAITISLKKEYHSIVIRQTNPCEPIEKEDLKKLFDRFYRPDKSRTMATGGFGVGLSIARSIVEAHKGNIDAECPAKGEIVFTITLR